MRIESIEVQHFRGFPKHYEFKLGTGGKNLLVYGENGSGKSSLFKALKGFFEATSGSDLLAQKNLFVEMSDPAIRLEVVGYDPTGIRLPGSAVYEWSTTSFPGSEALIQSANKTKGCLDYKALLETHYVHRDKDNVELFGLLINTVLNQVENPISRKEFGQEFKEIVDDMRKPMVGGYKDLYTSRIAQFNQGFKAVLGQLVVSSNGLLVGFFDDTKLTLNVAQELGFSGVGAKKHLDIPKVNLVIQFADKPMPKAHDFLNEARLSAVAIALYLGTLLIIPLSQLRVLVLDDLLIGIDMSNRVAVLSVLFEKFSSWQIILLTHDRLWFETARLQSELLGDWTAIELYASSDPRGYYAPRLEEVGSDAAKQQLITARQHHAAGDRMAACVYARSAFELVLKQMCHAKGAPVAFSLKPRKLDTDDYLEALSRWAQANTKKADFEGIFKLLRMYRGSVLNPGSHSTPTTLTDGEVEAAIRSLEICSSIPNYGKDAISVAGHFIDQATPKPGELMIGCAYLRTATWQKMMLFAKGNATPWPIGVPMDAPALWVAIKPAMQIVDALTVNQIELNRSVLIDPLSLGEMLALTKVDLNTALKVIAKATSGSPTPAKKTWSYAW